MRKTLAVLLSGLFLAAVYEFVRHLGIVPASVLPTIPQILIETIRNRERLSQAGLHTLGSVILSLLLTLPLGLGMAVAMALNRNVHDMMMPLLITIKSLPAVALVPFLVVAFREPLAVQTALTVSICFLPVTLAVYSGLQMSAGPLRHFALTATRRKARFFWLVTFPAAASEMLLGFKITLPLAFVGTLVAEMSSGGSDGLGNVILTTGNYSNLAGMFAAILVVAVVSTGAYLVLLLFIQRLFPASREAWL